MTLHIDFSRVLRTAEEKPVSYRVAAVDVHKKMLAVVVADVGGRWSISLNGGSSSTTPSSCTRWPNG